MLPPQRESNARLLQRLALGSHQIKYRLWAANSSVFGEPAGPFFPGSIALIKHIGSGV